MYHSFKDPGLIANHCNGEQYTLDAIHFRLLNMAGVIKAAMNIFCHSSFKVALQL